MARREFTVHEVVVGAVVCESRRKRTLLNAVIGALLFTGFFALLWFAGSAVTRY